MEGDREIGRNNTNTRKTPREQGKQNLGDVIRKVKREELFVNHRIQETGEVGFQ